MKQPNQPLGLWSVLLFSFLIFSGCDAMSPQAEDTDQRRPSNTTAAAGGSFQVQLSGAQNHTFAGSVRAASSAWNGIGFTGPIFPCDDDFFFDEDGEWDEEDWDDHMEWDDDDTCTDAADSTSILFLELMPTGENLQEESILLAFEGQLQPGTYHITDPDLADLNALQPPFVWAEYMLLPTQDSLAAYTGVSGTLTITEVAESSITGSFRFEATHCFCIALADLDNLFALEEDPMYEDNEAAFEELLQSYLTPAPLTIEGSFDQVELAQEDYEEFCEDDDFEDEDDEEEGEGDDDDDEEEDDEDDDGSAGN